MASLFERGFVFAENCYTESIERYLARPHGGIIPPNAIVAGLLGAARQGADYRPRRLNLQRAGAFLFVVGQLKLWIPRIRDEQQREDYDIELVPFLADVRDLIRYFPKKVSDIEELAAFNRHRVEYERIPRVSCKMKRRPFLWTEYLPKTLC